MSKDRDDSRGENDSTEWTYDGERSKFRAAVERIESNILEIGGDNLVLHWKGLRSADIISRKIVENVRATAAE